jgi:hypothetical protein
MVLWGQVELPDRYHTYEEIQAQLEAWDEEFGSNFEPYPTYYPESGIIYHMEEIGVSTHDHLPFYGVRLSFNADVKEDQPRVLILGQCHAEEIYGVEIAMELIYRLLHPVEFPTSYFNLKAFMENTEIWVIPTYNPEGLRMVHGYYDHEELLHDTAYRKNKRDVNENGIFDYVVGIGNDLDGVDLNRNYDFNWIFGDAEGQTDGGCSGNPSYIANYDYYRGEYAFSETETAAIKDFVLDQNFLLSIAYHSSRSGCVSEKVIYPWLWDGDKPSPDYPVIAQLGEEIAQLIPKEAESGNYQPTNSVSRRGNAHDWLYVNTGCIQYLIETGTENLQAIDVAVIDDTVERNLVGAFHLLKRAAGSNYQDGPDKNQITGTITDAETGLPLSGIEVVIEELNGPMLTQRTTDEFGRYRRLLHDATYTLTINSKNVYEPYSYTFVPSNGSITEHDINLTKLPEYNLTVNVSLPITYNSENSIKLTTLNHKLTYDLTQNGFEVSLPTGSYDFVIESENMLPYFDSINLESDTEIHVNMKWSAVYIEENFDFSDNWTVESGDWLFEEGVLYSQSSLVYDNEANYLLSYDIPIVKHWEGHTVFEFDLGYELEWENDNVELILNSLNDTTYIAEFSSHKWHEWINYNESFPVEVSSLDSSWLDIKLNSDATLGYRGLKMDKMTILYEPDGECVGGDIDRNGEINVLDILKIVNHIIDDVQLNGFEQCTSDLIEDSIINILDIISVVNLIIME